MMHGTLSRAGIPLSYSGPAWFVVVTNIGCQKRAQLGLIAQGYRTFLVQKTVWVTHSRLKKLMRKPLMDRYLFVEIDPDMQGFDGVHRVDGVEYLLSTCGVPDTVPRTWVADIMKRQLSGEFDFAKGPLPAGAIVEIVEGVFDGLRGVLLSHSARKGAASVKPDAASAELFERTAAVLVQSTALRAVPC